MEQTVKLDDLTLTPSEATRKVSVLFDDAEYTLDLTPESAEAFRALFADHDGGKIRALLSGGITAKIVQPAKEKKAGAKTEDEPKPAVVREWAKAEGIEVSEKGRVPADIVNRYKSRSLKPG